MIRVYIHALLPTAIREWVAETLSGVQIVWRRSAVVEFENGLGDAHICFGNAPVSDIIRAPHLQWVQLESTGFDEFIEASAVLGERDVQFTNLRGIYEAPVAESAVAFLLARVRGIHDLAIAQSERRWSMSQLRPLLGSISGSTSLLCGVGGIGRRIRATLESMGSRCVGFSRRSEHAELHSLDELDSALSEADFVIVSLPGTPETEKLFDRGRIGRFKNGAIFVNVGRGNCVDEDALVDALADGRLAAAALDVTRVEPLPRDDRLWTVPNLFLTQHTAGGTKNEARLKTQAFLENFERFKSGRPLQNRVDLGRGY